MNLDGHSWLVAKLCGRSGVEHRREDSSVTQTKSKSSHDAASFLRTPGTLAEVFVKRVGRGDDDGREEQLEDEAQRLSTALMSLQAGVGGGEGGASSSSFYAGGGAMMEDRGALSTPLVRQYDEVSSRQYERLMEQQREVEAMRAQVQALRATNETLNVAAAEVRIRGAGSAGGAGSDDDLRALADADCEELVSRVGSYATENDLLKQQLALTAMEIKSLHADLETRTHNVIVLRQELQRLRENEVTLKSSFADVLREAKEVHDRARRSTERTARESTVENARVHELRAETSEWAARAAAAEADVARVKQELAETTNRLDETKMAEHACRREMADARDYVAILETRLRSFQAESVSVHKQVKAAMQATEHATIQRDQAFARESALAEEVKELQKRLSDNVSRVDAHVVKLMQKRAETAADDLRAAQDKLRASQSENSELKAQSANKTKEINRLSSLRRETTTLSDVNNVDNNSAGVDDVSLLGGGGHVKNSVASGGSSSRHTTSRSAYDVRLEISEKGIEQRLKQAEEMLETQQNMTLKMESDAAKTIQVLREKLRRSRQTQTALSKQLNKVQQQ